MWLKLRVMSGFQRSGIEKAQTITMNCYVTIYFLSGTELVTLSGAHDYIGCDIAHRRCRPFIPDSFCNMTLTYVYSLSHPVM